MVVLSPEGDIIIVCPISTFVLNTLTLNYEGASFFPNDVTTAASNKCPVTSRHDTVTFLVHKIPMAVVNLKMLLTQNGFAKDVYDKLFLFWQPKKCQQTLHDICSPIKGRNPDAMRHPETGEMCSLVCYIKVLFLTFYRSWGNENHCILGVRFIFEGFILSRFHLEGVILKHIINLPLK